MAKPRVRVVCKSVFEGGESADLKSRFTRRWIDLVRRLERRGSSAAGSRR